MCQTGCNHEVSAIWPPINSWTMKTPVDIIKWEGKSHRSPSSAQYMGNRKMLRVEEILFSRLKVHRLVTQHQVVSPQFIHTKVKYGLSRFYLRMCVFVCVLVTMIKEKRSSIWRGLHTLECLERWKENGKDFKWCTL